MSNQNKICITVDSDLEDLIPDFLLRKKEDANLILTLIQKGEFNQIRILGHSMKGSGGGYGFDRITELGALIESSALEQNSDNIRESVNDLYAYLENIEVVYE